MAGEFCKTQALKPPVILHLDRPADEREPRVRDRSRPAAHLCPRPRSTLRGRRRHGAGNRPGLQRVRDRGTGARAAAADIAGAVGAAVAGGARILRRGRERGRALFAGLHEAQPRLPVWRRKRFRIPRIGRCFRLRRPRWRRLRRAHAPVQYRRLSSRGRRPLRGDLAPARSVPGGEGESAEVSRLVRRAAVARSAGGHGRGVGSRLSRTGHGLGRHVGRHGAGAAIGHVGPTTCRPLRPGRPVAAAHPRGRAARPAEGPRSRCPGRGRRAGQGSAGHGGRPHRRAQHHRGQVRRHAGLPRRGCRPGRRSGRAARASGSASARCPAASMSRTAC